MNKKLIIALIVFLNILQTILSAPISSWTTFQANPQRTGQSTLQGPQDKPAILLNVTLLSLQSVPILGLTSTIYVPSSNKLYGLNGLNGNKIFETTFNVSVSLTDGFPTIGSDGTVYTPSTEGNSIYAINGTDGKLKWSWGSDAPVTSTPLHDDTNGALYVSTNGWIFALNTSKTPETLLWKTQINNASKPVSYNPSLGFNNSIVVGTSAGAVIALDHETGDVLWTFENSLLDDVNTYAAIGPNGTVYVFGSPNSFAKHASVYALNGETGKVIWTSDSESSSEFSVSVGSNGLLYVVNGGFYALEQKNGKVQWKTSLDNCHSPAVVGSDETVYVNCDGHVVAISGKDGKSSWSYEVKGFSISGLSIGTDEILYVSYGSQSPLVNGLLGLQAKQS